jgi:hypothetical protein
MNNWSREQEIKTGWKAQTTDLPGLTHPGAHLLLALPSLKGLVELLEILAAAPQRVEEGAVLLGVPVTLAAPAVSLRAVLHRPLGGAVLAGGAGLPARSREQGIRVRGAALPAEKAVLWSRCEKAVWLAGSAVRACY